MKGYSTFPKALLEPHHQIVLYYIQDTCCGLLTLCVGDVGVFYSQIILGLDSSKFTGPVKYGLLLKIIFLKKSSCQKKGLIGH